MTNPCEIGLKCPFKRLDREESDEICVYPYGVIVPEHETFGIIESVDCPLVEYASDLEHYLLRYADYNGNIAIIGRGGWRMSTEPEPTMIWLSKDDFARLKEDLWHLLVAARSDRKGEQSCFYPQVWNDVICDDGRTVQLKINMAWRKREGFVHLKKRDGRRTFVLPYGSLCGCTVLPTGE